MLICAICDGYATVKARSVCNTDITLPYVTQGFYVSCDSCENCSPQFNSEEEAIEAWDYAQRNIGKSISHINVSGIIL